MHKSQQQKAEKFEPFQGVEQVNVLSPLWLNILMDKTVPTERNGYKQ
jgi:hypothetical protein